MKHAFYSQKQADLGGIIKWFDANNKEIQVTEVNDTGESGWDDAIYLGMVKEFSGRVSWGSMGKPNFGPL